MKYFLWMGLIVALIHCVLYKGLSHFSNSDDIWIFLVSCNKSLTDGLVKPLPVQKSTCLIIQRFNNPENKANTSLHIPITYDCTDFVYYLDHSQYNDQSLRFSFSIFHYANGDIKMKSPRMTSHCLTSRYGFHSLLGLCK